jgi:hypothetical protein
MTSELETPLNNRMYVDMLTNYNYVYYIDLMGKKKINNVDLYFAKLNGEYRFKICLRILELWDDGDKVQEKQIYYRYFHEDYLIQLSTKAFKDT